MPVSLQVNLDELRLALARAQADRPDRCFVDHPCLFDWIQVNRDQWLETLQAQLRNGYNPRPCHICPIPKPDFMVRPGSVLEIHDEVVYNTLVGRLFSKIRLNLADFQGDPDVAYQLAQDDAATKWVTSSFFIWRQFRSRSLDKLNNGYSHVVFTDITGFYDNIDIPKLISDLTRISGGFPNELTLLRTCLNRWAGPRAKGIPQGYSASDILAKVYLNVVDHSLANDGYAHLRYVDDFRIFTESELHAKHAIKKLTQLMHQRGLNLQTAKTRTLPRTEAIMEFQGVGNTIDNVQRQLAEELRDARGLADVSLSGAQINQLLDESAADHDQPPPEILERTFVEWFGSSRQRKFDKTLFHFLLRRLARVRSNIAVDYCIAALTNRPEETQDILDYIAAVPPDSAQRQEVLAYVGSPHAIYDYQLYQILRWFYDSGYDHPAVLARCREWAYDRNRDPCLRSYAFAYLGRYGDHSDLESIEQDYALASSDIEKAEHIAALVHHERSRRNEFYGRVKSDCDLVSIAVQWARR